MSLNDFDSRAGLETMVLHFGHDSFSSHSLSPPTTLGYIVVPKVDRVPLAAKSHNVQNRRLPRCGSVPTKLSVARDILAPPTSRPCTPVNHVFDATTNASPGACTPFQPLPDILATSPLRLPSFLDVTLQCLENDEPTELTAPSLNSESPPRPIPRQLAIDIPSVCHPNSPYVPWASPVRRNILRPLTPSSHMSQFSAYSRPYSRSGARAPEPQDPETPPPAHNRFLRLSKSFKNLRRTVKQGVRHVKNALKKTAKPKAPETVDAPVRCPSPFPPLPSPRASWESDTTTTLAVWLKQCEMNVERATPHFMTLQEYEERGSWIDLTSTRDESEIPSPLVSETGADERPEHSQSSPMSPTSPNSDSFPQLSMRDIWPRPPLFVTPSRGLSAAQRQREMSMPGGWDSPA